jgi:hypothetical protein
MPSAQLSEETVMSGTHPATEPAVTTASPADRRGRTRADRLVRPDVAAHYIDAGDRLGAVLIELDSAIRAALTRERARFPATTRHPS